MVSDPAKLQRLWEVLADRFGRDEAATLFDYVLNVPSTWREVVSDASESPNQSPAVRVCRLYVRLLDVLGGEVAEHLIDRVCLTGAARERA